MKKILLVLFLLLFVLSGCGRKKQNVSDDNDVVIREMSKEEETVLLSRIEELKYLDYLGKSFKTTDLTNQEVLQFIYSLYGKENITFKALEEKLKVYMDFPLEPENIICNTHFNILDGSDYRYLYSIYNDTYTVNKNHISHPDIGLGSDVYNQVISGRVEGDYYIIDVYKIFSDIKGYNANRYYGSYNDSSLKEHVIYTGSKDNIWNKVDKTLLPKYTYTFLKQGDNYLLKSYEIN